MTSAWKAAVAAAVVGGAAATDVPLPPPLACELPDDAGLPERLAALTAYRIAGASPLPDGFVPFDAPSGTGQCCSRRAGDLLLLAAEAPDGDTLAAEWCMLARRAGYQAPPEAAPLLAAVIWRLDPVSAAAVAAACGPALGAVESLPGAPRPPAPTPSVRAVGLAIRRLHDPAAALAELAAEWSGEDAETRLKLLAAFPVGLGLHDEAFLEGCLRDRSARIREAAASLLVRLPGSGFSRRMEKRAREWVRLETPALPRRANRVAVSDPPFGPDLRTDGLAESGSLPGQAVAAAPLRTWADSGPSVWLDALGLMPGADGQPHQEAVLAGWAEAALREQDRAWADAVAGLAMRAAGGTAQDAAARRVLPACSDAVAASAVSRLSRRRDFSLPALAALPGAWGPGLSAALSDCCLSGPWTWESAACLKALARNGDPACLERIEASLRRAPSGRPGLGKDTEAALDTLRLRAEISKELSA